MRMYNQFCLSTNTNCAMNFLIALLHPRCCPQINFIYSHIVGKRFFYYAIDAVQPPKIKIYNLKPVLKELMIVLSNIYVATQSTKNLHSFNICKADNSNIQAERPKNRPKNQVIIKRLGLLSECQKADHERAVA